MNISPFPRVSHDPVSHGWKVLNDRIDQNARERALNLRTRELAGDKRHRAVVLRQSARELREQIGVVNAGYRMDEERERDEQIARPASNLQQVILGREGELFKQIIQKVLLGLPLEVISPCYFGEFFGLKKEIRG